MSFEDHNFSYIFSNKLARSSKLISSILITAQCLEQHFHCAEFARKNVCVLRTPIANIMTSLFPQAIKNCPEA